MRRSRLP
ncbi:hypothetical protein NGA_0467800 [Nannochloropsis gaditana CCMP526]|nr:hypothetical protein NGA_0467800 [Nannochloropsis gaditana CCMP526]EKU22573.1 hypothetical protein NGA_0467800 [Nannochloropsis gaditana CCMP526]|eukprot:XP_005853787.1 hypothetical protein NGA_0467800 [Nannochloropsis gaditana CCMP526]